MWRFGFRIRPVGVVFFLGLCSLLPLNAGCFLKKENLQNASATSTTVPGHFTGKVSLGGQIVAFAPVEAYLLREDGTRGDKVGSTDTDLGGIYSLILDPEIADQALEFVCRLPGNSSGVPKTFKAHRSHDSGAQSFSGEAASGTEVGTRSPGFSSSLGQLPINEYSNLMRAFSELIQQSGLSMGDSIAAAWQQFQTQYGFAPNDPASPNSGLSYDEAQASVAASNAAMMSAAIPDISICSSQGSGIAPIANPNLGSDVGLPPPAGLSGSSDSSSAPVCSPVNPGALASPANPNASSSPSSSYTSPPNPSPNPFSSPSSSYSQPAPDTPSPPSPNATSSPSPNYTSPPDPSASSCPASPPDPVPVTIPEFSGTAESYGDTVKAQLSETQMLEYFQNSPSANDARRTLLEPVAGEYASKLALINALKQGVRNKTLVLTLPGASVRNWTQGDIDRLLSSASSFAEDPGANSQLRIGAGWNTITNQVPSYWIQRPKGPTYEEELNNRTSAVLLQLTHLQAALFESSISKFAQAGCTRDQAFEKLGGPPLENYGLYSALNGLELPFEFITAVIGATASSIGSLAQGQPLNSLLGSEGLPSVLGQGMVCVLKNSPSILFPGATGETVVDALAFGGVWGTAGVGPGVRAVTMFMHGTISGNNAAPTSSDLSSFSGKIADFAAEWVLTQYQGAKPAPLVCY